MTLSSSQRLILHAPNVHIGGGAVLLTALLQTLVARNQKVIALLDERYPLTIANNHLAVTRFSPTLMGRLSAEMTLHGIVQENDLVLCFGNLPPLFQLAAPVLLFVQNRNMLGLNALRDFGWRVGMRLGLERCWLRSRKHQVKRFLVQTESMCFHLKRYLGENIDVAVVPWILEPKPYARSHQVNNVVTDKLYDFIYVATADPHKNHQRLIEAWCLLAEQNIRPSLCLTIDDKKTPEFSNWLSQQIAKYKLNIINVGHVSHAEVLQLYRQAHALIFPSQSESFGLPLLEARQAGIPILAGEIDFVRDIVDPEQTFDPTSALSISRAVQRHLNQLQLPLQLHSPYEFIETIFQYDV